MKNLPLAGSRPLFACILLLVGFLFGCRKDNFTTVEEFSQTNNPSSLSANYPISVEEALIYFAGIDLQASNSFQDEYSHAFVTIAPLWGQSLVGHSQSGKEMVIVPLADSSIRILNNGRADAKLLFTKVGQDSITAQILLYVADSAHHASNGSNLNLATFSGAFAFFDLTYKFQYGIVMEAGAPFLWIDSVGMTPTESVPDREGYDCWEGSLHVLCDPPPIAFTNNLTEGCTAVLFLQGSPCGEGGGGGDSGNNGNNNGNNTGGSTGTGNGNGNGTGNTYTPPNYWDVMAGQIPLEIFLQQNGTLPEGFSVQLFQQFIDIYNYFRNLGQNLSLQQLQWLSDHPGLVPIIWNALFLPEVGEERALIRPVLSFAMAHDLNAAQYHFLLYNGTVFEQAKSFTELIGLTNSEITQGIQAHIDLMMTDSHYAGLNSQANYPDIGTEGWANTLDGLAEWPGDGFWKLKPAEKALVLNHPVAALKINKNKGIARAKQKAFWGSDPNVLWLGKGDAFLHTYFQAINTQSVGPGLTLLFANAHETEHPTILHLETEMDLFNNDIGILTGYANLSATIHTMADIVHQRVLDGDCKYLDPVDHISSPPYPEDPASCPTCLNGILPNTVMKWTNQ